MKTRKFTICFFGIATGKVNMMDFTDLNTAISAVNYICKESKVVDYNMLSLIEALGVSTYRFIIEEEVTVGKTTRKEACWVSPYLIFE